eukprot:TRINITY_DN4462_c0_g1_i4.p1 TRINITY_DN4462_c0_g1~~TRINITY_DN4462_c0_g1_i4.p1  ORF type:complete len:1068 (-),score=202.61 TRINITY_DN4462_c0_g1_i4:276-3479(-)
METLIQETASAHQSVSCQGFLLKKGDRGLIKTWKRRFFSLELEPEGFEEALIRYSELQGTPTIGSIRFDEFTVLETGLERDLTFYIWNKFKERVWQLQAETPADKKRWIDAIRHCISYHQKISPRGRHEILISGVRFWQRLSLRAVETEFELEVSKDSKSSTCVKTYKQLKKFRLELAARHDLVLPPLPFGDLDIISAPVGSEDPLKSLNTWFAEILKHKRILTDLFLEAFIEEEPLYKNSDTLKISVLEGRHLSRLFGIPNPVCSVGLVDRNSKSYGPTAKTGIEKETISPKWPRSEFCFELNKEIEGVLVTCWGSNAVLTDEFLGKIFIPLESIKKNSVIQHWFPLKTDYLEKISGDIKLQLFYETHSADSTEDIPKPVESPEQRRMRRRTLTRDRGRKVGALELELLYNPPIHMKWDGSLLIRVVRGYDIGKIEHNSAPIDHYFTLRLGNEPRVKTRTRKYTFNPLFEEEHFFVVDSDMEEPTLTVELYQVKGITGDGQLLGKSVLVLSDHVPQSSCSFSLIIEGVGLHREDLIPKELGITMAEMGYFPNLPIVLIPGVASSALFVQEGHQEWVDQRIWISLAKLSSERVRNLWSSKRTAKLNFSASSGDLHASGNYLNASGNYLSSSGNSTSDAPTPFTNIKDEEYVAFANLWLQHMCLQEDGFSDPKGVKVRTVKGKEGVSYMDDGFKGLSYVMGPLIDELHNLGYTDENLIAAPYDWRCPPQYLESRDSYFSDLKAGIEKMVAKNKQKVVLVAHSMGNRICQYFFHFILSKYEVPTIGQQWIDDHIHTLFSVAAPWLGASRMVRAIITGESMGLEAFLSQANAVAFSRSLGSMSMIFPINTNLYFNDPEHEAVIYFKEDESVGFKKSHIPTFLREAGAEKQWQMFEKFYLSENFFGSESASELLDDLAVLKAPPIKRMYAIYGTNIPTEKMFFYAKDSKSGKLRLKSPGIGISGYKIKNGIVYETEDTPQKIIRERTGIDGTRSGDGSVPYVSLNYCATWKKDIPEFQLVELPGVEHQGILNNRIFFKHLIEYVSQVDPSRCRVEHRLAPDEDFMNFLEDV